MPGLVGRALLPSARRDHWAELAGLLTSRPDCQPGSLTGASGGYDTYTEMGILAFADRALHELEATGETVRKRQDDTRNDLTPQEEQITRLALEGPTKFRDRCSAVHKRTNGRMAFTQRVHEARHHLAPRPPALITRWTGGRRDLKPRNHIVKVDHSPRTSSRAAAAM
jgi:hypothetical protein